MTVLERMRARMRRAEQEGISRQSFLRNEAFQACRLLESARPSAQEVGREVQAAAAQLRDEPEPEREQPRAVF